MEKRTDVELVSDALAGQGEAFALLVLRYQDYAYGVAIGHLSDFDLARDVVQEAFLHAYRDLRKLKDPARFAGWLRGIVRHTALRALRELERVRALAEKLGPIAEPTVPRPDQSAEDAERREIVRRALERLNEKNREAVSLYYVDGLSYRDIAEFLDVTEPTVQGRLQRARAQLRKELTMVEETFKDRELPEDFSAEIKRLLDAAEARGQEHERAIKRLAEIGAPAVQPLCEALGDPRIPVRRAAARALCAIGDPRALQPILRVLYTQCAQAWQTDVYENGRVLAIPGMREVLLKVVREGKWPEQWVALMALAYTRGDKEVYDCIYEVFQDPDTYLSNVRCAALEALCRLSPECAVDLATQALHGPDLRLRRWACWLAVRTGFLPSIEPLLKAFGRGVGWWGRVCAANLVLKHGEEGKETLERVMRSGSPAERCTASVALARTGSKEALNILMQEILGVHADRNWVKAVSRTLARQYGDEILAWVDAARPRVTDLSAVLWTLARGRVKQAGPMIEEFFRDGTPSIRAAAARILARQRGIAFLPELRRCLREGRPRKLAQEAFWQVHRLGDAATPVVEEMLESDDWTERKAAVCLLRRWGKLAPEQQMRAEKDPHIAVRHAANWRPQWVKAAQ